MEIIYPPTLLPFLNQKHLLLDTNIFRDVIKKPSLYAKFFNDLKQSDVTLTTIDFVKYELLKGSASKAKYTDRNKFIDDIIDITLPNIPIIYHQVHKLIQEYGIDGSGISITDLFLGATLMQYKSNICLLTRDCSDFIPRIFELKSIINISHPKGIHTYGIYQYSR